MRCIGMPARSSRSTRTRPTDCSKSGRAGSADAPVVRSRRVLWNSRVAGDDRHRAQSRCQGAQARTSRSARARYRLAGQSTKMRVALRRRQARRTRHPQRSVSSTCGTRSTTLRARSICWRWVVPSSSEPGVHEWGSAPEFVGPRHELRERLLLDLLESAHPGRRILNAGAGQGSFTRLLEDRGYEVVSTDLSPSAVAVLETRVRGEVVRADLTALPFSDGTFDAVVAGEVLEHIDDEQGALAEVGRVLRPAGVMAASVPAHPEWFGA